MFHWNVNNCENREMWNRNIEMETDKIALAVFYVCNDAFNLIDSERLLKIYP